MDCIYGCGQEAKFKTKAGKDCCEASPNSCPENKKKNSASLKKKYESVEKRFPEDARAKAHESQRVNLKKKPFEEWGRILKNELILSEQNGKCDWCKITKEWNGKPLVFELDHIDGNNKNEKRDNLRLLCPNCHSQTPTWRRKKKCHSSPTVEAIV